MNRSGIRKNIWRDAGRHKCRGVLASILLALSCALPLTPAQASEPRLISYRSLPGAVASSSYTLKVNGRHVFVEKFGDVSMARFAFIGEARIEITSSAEMPDPVISPRSYQITPNLGERSMQFAITQPRKLIIQTGHAEKLLLFADGPERRPPRPGQPGVRNLATYLDEGRDPEVPVTAQLQRAINQTSAANDGSGGVLYVPDGLYMSAQLRLKSNVELYLSSGALIRAVPEFSSSNYPTQHGADSSFIYIARASNVKISGRGVIDGNGYQLRKNSPGSGNNKLLRTRAATGVSLEDLLFRDSARWTLHFLYSDDIHVRNVKIVNDLRVDSGDTLPFVSNTDGIDIDASTFVTVENAFVYTTDDAFSPKVTGYMGVQKRAHDIYIHDNVIWTQKCALKVGNEVLADISDVHFDNNDTVLADRFLALWNIGGHRIRTVSATHNRTETIGVRDNKSFFYYYIRNQPGQIRGVDVNGLDARHSAPWESRLEGFDSTHRVADFWLRNMYVSGSPIGNRSHVPLVFRNKHVSNIRVSRPGEDGLPLVRVTASDDYAIEGRDSGTYTFTRAGNLRDSLKVFFSLSGSATPDSDYVALGNAITFPAGAQQLSLTLVARADAETEREETAILKLLDRPGYQRDAASTAEISIANVRPPG